MYLLTYDDISGIQMNIFARVAHPIDYRYGSEELRRLFSPENIYRKFAEVELAVAEAQAELGIIPKEVPEALRKAISKLSYSKIIEKEKEVKHDLMALILVLAEEMGELGEYVHYGLTSSDVKDTAMILLLRDALNIIKQRLRAVISALIDLAERYSDLPCVARTHGVHANVYLFGLKFAIFADELSRSFTRICQLEERLYIGKLSGAVGIHTSFGELGEEFEKRALLKLGLKPAKGVTQILPRDPIAELIFVLALISTQLDKIATEIRNLQRTEILEVEEPFSTKQVGSSAMPHKKNPILSENVSGLARVLRGLVISALENIVLWHERDLSNSATERVILPEAFLLLDEQLRKMERILRSLRINEKKVRENIWLTKGLIFSEALMMRLAKKIGRQKAHALVRELALRAMQEGTDFLLIVERDEQIRAILSDAEIKEIFEPEKYLKVAKKRLRELINSVKESLEATKD